MKKFLLASLWVSLLSLFSSQALASDWSGWESFSIPAARDQHWICGMETIHRTARAQNATIKLIESTPYIQFDLYRYEWSFREGASVPVRLDFDDREPLDLVAYGDGHFVSIAIPVEVTAVFLSLVNDKKRIRVFFREGNDPAWKIDLDGAPDALADLLACYKENQAFKRHK